MEILPLVLDYVVVPVIVWAYLTDKKITILETKLAYIEKTETKYIEDTPIQKITAIFSKI